MKILPDEECVTQHKPLLCDFKIRKVKDSKRKTVPRRKIMKLREVNVKSGFSSYVKEFRESTRTDRSLEGYRQVLNGVLQGVRGDLWKAQLQIDKVVGLLF